MIYGGHTITWISETIRARATECNDNTAKLQKHRCWLPSMFSMILHQNINVFPKNTLFSAVVTKM